MPSLRQSASVSMDGWEPLPAPIVTRTHSESVAATASKNPNMLAPMPTSASTADAFQRQFYGGANLPSFRILPGRRGAL